MNGTPAKASRSTRATIDWPLIVQRACGLIEISSPGLPALARALQVSASELQRQFTRRLGVSPKAYAQALALHRLVRGAARAPSALDAVMAAGFESSSVGYAAARPALGVTPGHLRGAVAIGWWMGLSDLGWMLLGATARGICWLTFGISPGALLQEMRAAYPKARLFNDEARLYGWFDQVRSFVLLPREALALPIDIQGTAFQSRVWQALRLIPLGETRSYRELAQQLGQPDAARAVAAACGANQIGVLIPCHRVIGADGAITGYRWGVTRKRALLQRESGEHRKPASADRRLAAQRGRSAYSLRQV